MTDKILIDRAVAAEMLEFLVNGNFVYPTKFYKALRAALERPALAQQPAVPPGYKLVPVEPTPEMLQAADDGDDAYTLRNFGPAVQRVMQGPYDHWCAMLNAAPEATAQHPDDEAVDRFAAAMKAKMAKQRAKGYGGWNDPADCPTDRLQTMLVDHIVKGDPVDVGNFAMMLFNRGEPTAAQKEQP